MARVQLEFQNAVPCVAARAGRSRQAKDIGAACHTRTGARLDRRCRNLLVRQHVKENCEAFDIFFKQRLHGFRRDIAACEARAACGDHAIDMRIADPSLNLCADGRYIVLDDCACGHLVARSSRQFRQQIAGLVFGGRARVRHRQQRNPHRYERAAFIKSCHRQILTLVRDAFDLSGGRRLGAHWSWR